MKTNCLMPGSVLNRRKSKGWKVFGIALISFAVGSLATTKLMDVRQVSANSNRVFELRVYHAVPGKYSSWSHAFATPLQRLSRNMI